MRSQQLFIANQWFMKAMEADPTSARTWINQGRVLNLSNEHFKAEEAFKQAMQLDSKLSLAWFHMGMLFITQGLEDKGIKFLEEGLIRSPNDAMGSLQIASIYWKRGDLNKAKKVIENALRNPPTSSDLYQNLKNTLDAINKSLAGVQESDLIPSSL
jgi:tetratricopeptide (TPR) repeat protein